MLFLRARVSIRCFAILSLLIFIGKEVLKKLVFANLSGPSSKLVSLENFQVLYQAKAIAKSNSFFKGDGNNYFLLYCQDFQPKNYNKTSFFPPLKSFSLKMVLL
jgi:hypothetical protein